MTRWLACRPANHASGPARRRLATLCLVGCLALPLPAQEPGGEARTAGALRFFLDCDCDSGDLDFFRRELTFVTFVREPADAQLHVLVTEQETGAGGTEYTLSLIGGREFAGIVDTLRYVAEPSETDELTREGVLRVLKLGLVRYVAHTPLSRRLSISYEVPADAEAQPATRDPWNFWVFRTSARGFFNGESSSRFLSLGGSLTASRVTEAWKIEWRANANYSRNTFELDDSTSVISSRRSYGTEALAVRSISAHWSVGGKIEARASNFVNQDLSLELAPAIEYDVFPYSESTRRQLTLLYTVGLRHFDYEQRTLFGQERETLIRQSLTAGLSLRQPWGSTSVSVEASHYVHDLNRNRLQVFGDVNVRLLKGLSLNLFGEYAVLHDQLYLSAVGATPEDILTQRRQLETSYQYFASVGLSYTFGSIYNNVVNPRLSGGSGFF